MSLMIAIRRQARSTLGETRIERWRVCSETKLFRHGSSAFGIGSGYLIVVAVTGRDFSIPLIRTFGVFGLVLVFLGMLLMIFSWSRSKGIELPPPPAGEPAGL